MAEQRNSSASRGSGAGPRGSQDNLSFTRKSSFVASPYTALIETEAAEAGEPIGLAGWMLMMLGIGYLFPFSAMTQPVDYWKLLFPDKDLDFEISAVFMYLNLFMLTLVVFVFPDMGYTIRIVGGFIGQSLILAFVPSSYFLHLTEGWNYVIVLGSTGVIAIVTALLDSACLSLAANYPVQAQEFLQLGIGVSTLIGSVYRVVTKLAFPPGQVVESSLLYFYSGSATLVVCTACYFYLLTMPITKRCVREFSGSLEESQALLGDSLEEVDKKHVIKKIRNNGMLSSFHFFITLALWPGLMSAIPCFSDPKLTGDWWPLILLLIFAVFDCVGRLVVKYRLGLNAYNIWVPIAIRSLFIPMMIMIAKEIMFTHDAWSVFATVVLGFTNGYIGTLSLLFIIDMVEPHETAYAGTLASFFLNTGLVLGSTLGLVISHFIKAE